MYSRPRGRLFVEEITYKLTKIKLKLIKSNKNLILFVYVGFFL